MQSVEAKARSSSVVRGAVMAAVVAAGLGSGAAAADDGAFCRSLRHVVADAPDAFEALRGVKLVYVPEDGGGDDSTRYAATQALPGARGCGVDRDRADGEDLLSTYVCWFDPATDGGAEVKRLAGEIGGCIGWTPADQLTVTARGATVDMHRKQFALSLTALARGGPVVLEIGQR